MKAPFADLLRRMGVNPGPRAADDKSQAEEEVRLFLDLPDKRLFVGRLWKQREVFLFQYSDEFLSRTDLPLLPDFPRRDKGFYRSERLWPFFLVRLPPLGRADVQRAVKEEGIEPANTLEMLARLGRRAISSPYELELGGSSLGTASAR